MDHVADLKNGGRRRLAKRRAPFTCRNLITKQYGRNWRLYTYSALLAELKNSLSPFRSLDSLDCAPMASFTTLPLMDASRDSRIHDWIAEQYSFALSEFQDDCLWRNDPPSLRESKLLPDDFDLIVPPPPPPTQRRDTDSDHDSRSTHSCDPPLLPSPLPLLQDAQSHLPEPQGSTNLEDALDGLIREMNSWRLAPASRSALTLTLSDRNKVCPGTAQWV